MAEPSSSRLPVVSPEQRRIAADTFERARQVLASSNHDYAINLLRQCCKIDPSNFLFRQTLRRAQKEKYGNNLQGSRFAFATTPGTKAKMKGAKATRDYVSVLEHGEDILAKNPWDLGTQMDMSESFEALGLSDLAVFSLDQARQKYPNDATLNRALARLFEKRGDFQKAIALWRLVQEADPRDVEAASKAKNLAASETIARGGYEAVASGTKESPVVNRIEAAAVEKQDRVGRETAAILKRIEADPTEPAHYIQLSAVYRKNNQFDRARAALQQGFGPTSQHYTLQQELMELDLLPLRANYDLTDARWKAAKQRVAADEIADEDINGPSVEQLAEARVNLRKEILAREAELFRMKADRMPNELIHRFELGLRLLRLDQLDEAIAELQLVRRDEKLKGQAAMYLGLGFRKRNNFKLAQRNFDEALTTLTTPADEPHRKEVLFQLATLAAEQGQYPRAIELAHELANIDFGFKGISTLLDQWETETADN